MRLICGKVIQQMGDEEANAHYYGAAKSVLYSAFSPVSSSPANYTLYLVLCSVFSRQCRCQHTPSSFLFRTSIVVCISCLIVHNCLSKTILAVEHIGPVLLFYHPVENAFTNGRCFLERLPVDPKTGFFIASDSPLIPCSYFQI